MQFQCHYLQVTILRLSVYFVIFDATMILAFYIYGFYLSNELKKRNLISMKKTDYDRIKREYFLLISVSIIRIFLNIFFRVYPTF